MYEYLKGQLVDRQPGRVILDVGGVGFCLNVPDSTLERIGEAGGSVQLWTHLHFKEDQITLYGFSDPQERDVFRLLITVSGVGPRSAIQILSGIQPEELVRALADEDWKRFTLIPGIGPKTARRLLIELKEKLTDQELLVIPSASQIEDPVLAQAYNALQNLGFPPEKIRYVLREIPREEDLETIVKQALTKLAS